MHAKKAINIKKLPFCCRLSKLPMPTSTTKKETRNQKQTRQKNKNKTNDFHCTYKANYIKTKKLHPLVKFKLQLLTKEKKQTTYFRWSGKSLFLKTARNSDRFSLVP